MKRGSNVIEAAAWKEAKDAVNLLRGAYIPLEGTALEAEVESKVTPELMAHIAKPAVAKILTHAMIVLIIAPIVVQANAEYQRTHDFTAAVEHASFQGVKDTFFVDQGYEIEQSTLAKEEYVFGNVRDAVLSWGSLKATAEMEYAAEHDGPELDGVDWEHAIPGANPFPAESDPNAPYE